MEVKLQLTIHSAGTSIYFSTHFSNVSCASVALSMLM